MGKRKRRGVRSITLYMVDTSFGKVYFSEWDNVWTYCRNHQKSRFYSIQKSCLSGEVRVNYIVNVKEEGT